VVIDAPAAFDTKAKLWRSDFLALTTSNF